MAENRETETEQVRQMLREEEELVDPDEQRRAEGGPEVGEVRESAVRRELRRHDERLADSG
jgi:hypothetical protein